MGYQEKTIGGGPATGLANDFTAFLKNMITTGSFGGGTAGQHAGAANPMGDAAGIFGLLNSIISNPQADQGVQSLINKDIERGRNDLRARFGSSGGMAFGSPAGMVEAVYQAEQAPRTAMAMDQMAQARLAALMPLFGMTRDISAMGIPQAQTVMEPKGWMQGLNLLLDVANTAANFIPGGGGGKTDSRTPTYAGNRSGEGQSTNPKPALAPIPGINPDTYRMFMPLPLPIIP